MARGLQAKVHVLSIFNFRVFRKSIQQFVPAGLALVFDPATNGKWGREVSVAIVSKPCSALQLIPAPGTCFTGSGAGIVTWHSASERDLCPTVKARSFLFRPYLYNASLSLWSRSWCLENETKLMSRRTYIYIFWILSTRKHTWKYVHFCIVFESFREENQNIKVTGCSLWWRWLNFSNQNMIIVHFRTCLIKCYLYRWVRILTVFLAELKFGTAAITGNSADGLIGSKTLLSFLASCDVFQTDHILCADSSTFSLTAEIASTLLQGNNNLQIKMPQSCRCILSVIGRSAYPA